MAFFNKASNILRQTISKHINYEISVASPSVFQTIRCMSSSKLFVGGLAYATDDMSLREAFSAYGDVQESRVIVDRETGRSRGFGFITYSDTEAASAAIQALDQKELHGRMVRVNYANDRSQGGGGYRGGGGGLGGGGYGGGGGGGGGGYGGNNYGSGDYGGGSQNYGVAGGVGGSDGFASGGYGGSSYGSGGYGGNAASGYFGRESQNSSPAGGFADTGSSFASADDGGQVDGNYRDNDEGDGFARRA